MNSKRKFKNFGKGAVKGEKFTELLKLKKEEAEAARLREENKKKIAEMHRQRYQTSCIKAINEGISYQNERGSSKQEKHPQSCKLTSEG